MNTWLEDNFLEKLSAHSPAQSDLVLCPDARMLRLQSDLESAESASQKLATHIRNCPTCLDIQQRLLQFDQFTDLDSSADSADSEKRLDSWFKGFLAAQTVHSHAPAIPTPLKPKAHPVIPISKPGTSSIAPWALAAAALILLAFATFQLRNKLFPAIPNQSAQTTPTAPVPSNPQPRSSQVPSPAPSTATSASPTPVAPLPQKPFPTLKPSSAPLSPDPTVQSATSNPVSTPTLPTLPAVLSPENSKPSSSSPGTTEGARAIDPALRPNLPNSQPHTPLAPIHFPSGVRIWLSLNSVSNQPDGRFLFQATLLLDTVDAGKILLPKGALIEGSGQKIGKQTSLQLTRILSRGQYFRLASPSSSLTNAPGFGKTVSFKSGQVLELWLSSATTFVPMENSSAYPQN